MSRDDSLTYRLSGDEQLTEGIIVAVAMATDRDPLDLPPLSEVVDPDALESLYASTQMKRPPGDWHVEFTYTGSEVVVHSYGLVKVRPTPSEGGDGGGGGRE